MKRRSMLGILVMLSPVPALSGEPASQVHVYKNPTCGCCTKWVDHLRASGLSVKVTQTDDAIGVRKRLGIPDRFGACHTASVDGYAIEGHVPAAEIKRLLATRPQAIGLAVPAMPVGSPGMEYGDRKDPYDVFLIDRQGNEAVFASYTGLVRTAGGASASAPAAMPLTDGEVRKVDKKQGEVVLKHGDLTNLGMPAMTMAFAADEKTLAKVKPGDKVRFHAEMVKGKPTVTHVESAK
jgi:Cu/Ag efflux protein CusF